MKKAILSLAVAGLMTGCASILSESTYPVSISSVPDGAHFEIRNKAGVVIHSGKTPGQVNLKASAGFFQGETYQVSIKKDGYKESVGVIDSSLDGWYLGNIIFGGLLGILIVDPATGAMWKLPEYHNVTLEEQAALTMMGTPEIDGVRVVSIEDIPQAMRAQLVRVN